MPETATPRTLLIRSPNWVGDTAMAFPLVRALREALPGTRLVALARPSVAPLWSLAEVDDVIVADDKAGGAWNRPAALRAQARAAATAGADAALLLPSTVSAAIVARLARIPVRIGYGRGFTRALLTRALDPAPLASLHRAHGYLGLLAGLDLDVPRLEWRPLDARVLAGADAGVHPPTSRPRVGLAVGSVATSRRWPTERFAQLADRLAREDGAWVALIGGPDDRAQAAAVLRHASTAPVDLTGRVPLSGVPSLLSHLSAVVANDSGAAHLAALAGTPCAVLFGAGNPRITAPLSKVTRVLSHPVFCSPCEKNTCKYALECMTGLSVSTVLAAARELLKDGRTRPSPRGEQGPGRRARPSAKATPTTAAAAAAAVFLDRDGTLNVDPDFVRSPDQLEPLAGAGHALRRLADRGFKLVVVSNQSGVGRGMITPETLDAIHARLQQLLGVAFDGIYWCPHHPTEALGEYRVECDCRKPRSGLVERALTELAIDRARSYLVGDSLRDLECGRGAALRTILVLTGKGATSLARIEAGEAPPPDHVAADLAGAADWILAS